MLTAEAPLPSPLSSPAFQTNPAACAVNFISVSRCGRTPLDKVLQSTPTGNGRRHFQLITGNARLGAFGRVDFGPHRW